MHWHSFVSHRSNVYIMSLCSFCQHLVQSRRCGLYSGSGDNTGCRDWGVSWVSSVVPGRCLCSSCSRPQPLPLQCCPFHYSAGIRTASWGKQEELLQSLMVEPNRISVVWDVRPCSLLYGYLRFEENCCFHLQGVILTWSWAVSSFSYTVRQTTRRHLPEGSILVRLLSVMRNASHKTVFPVVHI